MNNEREPWFVRKANGLGLTPVSWQGWCVTLLTMFCVGATVIVILRFVHDPRTAAIGVIVGSAAELAVLIALSCWRAGSRKDL